MSDDLVKRLRNPSGIGELRWIRAMSEAADEIERLRAALSDLLRDEQKLDDGDPRLEASRLAARAALSPLPAKKGGTVD